ncbi:MAG: ribosome recycling factor, partial [Patescibacteria group bacterium]
MDESFLNPGRQKMEEVVKLVSEDLTSIQTGRAKPAMVEGIKLEAYEGSTMEIRELANITAPDPKTVMIKPWDISLVAKIAKAIQQSDLQVNPVV